MTAPAAAAPPEPHHDLMIVGSGLAGTITLVQELLKIAADPHVTPLTPVDIAILERFPKQKFGGVAYGSSAGFDKYRLNLSSRRATPFMADAIPEGFPSFPDYIVDLAEKAPGKAEKEKLLSYLQDPPRELFGHYLSHLVDLAMEKVGRKARVTSELGEALDLDVTGQHPKLTVKTDGQERTVEANQVVLATGQREIQRPAFVQGIVGNPLYLEDLYAPQASDFYDKLLAEQARRDRAQEPPCNVLILGSGLSAEDAALRLLQSGYTGKMTMISRNGLEHAGYGATTTEDYLKNRLIGEPRPEKVAELEKAPPRFLRTVRAQAELIRGGKSYDDVEHDVVTAMTREFSVLMRRGYTPEEVLGYWERFVPDIGDALPDEVCGSIYNRYATWMGVHRVGTTPANTHIIEEAKKSGQLTVVSGFISAQAGEMMHGEGGKISATIAPTQRTERAGDGKGGVPRFWDSALGDEKQRVTRDFDFAISGLGNSVTYSAPRDPFWANLVRKGLAVPNKKAGDGLELDPHDLTLVDAEGRRVENVTAVGVPAFGATMFGRFPHPEKPGVTGGRILPFTANIVGITGGVIAMTEALHDRMMQEYRPAPEPQAKDAAVVTPLQKNAASVAQMQRGDLGGAFAQGGQTAAPSRPAESGTPSPRARNVPS